MRPVLEVVKPVLERHAWTYNEDMAEELALALESMDGMAMPEATDDARRYDIM